MFRLKFSAIEIQHLLKAWIMVSVAFAIMLKGSDIISSQFIFFFLVSALTVGVGFLLHELSHKYFAQKYGCFAEFRADTLMLMIAIFMSYFLGFFFAAPGAVMIHGTITTKRNGIISISGPAANAILAIIFFAFTFIQQPLVHEIARYGLLINAWLALFNMIPFGNIDGQKILRWSKTAYFSLLIISAGLLALGFVWK